MPVKEVLNASFANEEEGTDCREDASCCANTKGRGREVDPQKKTKLKGSFPHGLSLLSPEDETATFWSVTEGRKTFHPSGEGSRGIGHPLYEAVVPWSQMR